MPPEETSRRSADEAIIAMAINMAELKEHIKSVDEKVSAIDLKCLDLNGYKQRIVHCETKIDRHDLIFDRTASVLIVVVLLGGLGFMGALIIKKVFGV